MAAHHDDFFGDDDSGSEGGSFGKFSNGSPSTVSSLQSNMSSMISSFPPSLSGTRSIWSPDYRSSPTAPSPVFPHNGHHHSVRPPYEPPPVSPDCCQLLIRDIDNILTEDCLRRELSAFGRIVNFKLKQDKVMMAKKFAYVTYSTPFEARQAVDQINSESFLPRFTLPRRPRAKLHEAPKKPASVIMAPGGNGEVLKCLVVGYSLPELEIIQAESNGSFVDQEDAVNVGRPVQGQLLAHAEITSEKAVTWSLARVTNTDGKSAGFSDLEIILPRENTKKGVFNGQLFAASTRVEKVRLDGVEMIGDNSEAEFMAKKFCHGGFAFVRRTAPGLVQVFKTAETSGADLARALENFGMCRVQPTPTQTTVLPTFIPTPQKQEKCIYRLAAPAINEPCSIRVTHVPQHGRIFHVQVVGRDLTKTLEVEKLLTRKRHELRNHSRLKAGSLVVAAYNGQLCRGITVGDRNPEDTDYKVYFFDWGNTDSSPVASVDRPTEFWECAAQAVPCLLPYDATDETRAILAAYASSQTVIDGATFTAGKTPTQIRDYVATSDPTQYAYELNMSIIEK